MEKKVANYQLVRESDEKIVFEGAHTKHYLEAPYCAIFERYPATETRVMVCKRVAENDNGYGMLRCRLVSRGADSPAVEIGKYVPLREVRSEKEATDMVEGNQKSTENLIRILGIR